jgi:hypothetical protein
MLTENIMQSIQELASSAHRYGTPIGAQIS